MSSLRKDMSVVAERVVAPHGWLRYDVERIRSVRHPTDPKHRPGRPWRVWILCEALSGVEAQRGVELRELTGSPGTGRMDAMVTLHAVLTARWLVGRRGDRGRGGVGRGGHVLVFVFVVVL